MVQQVWDEEYSNLDITVCSNNGPATKRQKLYYNAFEEHCEQSRIDSIQADPLDDNPFDDEYTTWQSSQENSDKTVRDPISYWHERRFQYAFNTHVFPEWLSTFSQYNRCLQSVRGYFQPQDRWLSPNGLALRREQ